MAGSHNEVQVPFSFEGGRLLELAVQSDVRIEDNVDENISQDRAGAFSYKHCRHYSRTTRNRSIFWKISQNAVYLTEVSQDLHLYGNQICLRIKNLTFLPCVKVLENANVVTVIIATAHSVHRLTWHHPTKEKQGAYISSSIDASSPSIFVNNPTGVTADSWCFAALPKKCLSFSAELSSSGECFISLITVEGSLVFVTLPAFNSQTLPQISELKQTSIMKRLWTGLVPTVLRGDNLPHDSVQSCEIHTIGKECFIFALCKDLKIRIWSCKTLECVEDYDLSPLLPDVLDVQSGIAQAHMIRKATDIEQGNHFIGVFLNFRFQSQFFAFEIIEDEGDVELSLLSSHFTKQTCLMDFALTHKYIWALWTNTSGDSVLQYAAIEEANGLGIGWNDVTLQVDQDSTVFVHHSIEPNMTLKSFDEEIDLNVSSKSSFEELKEAVERLIQYEIQNFMLDNEIDQEEFYNLQMQSWSRFYASAVQYDQVERKPIGLHSDESSGLVSIIRQNYRGYLVSNSWLEMLYLKDQHSHDNCMRYLHNEAGIADTDVCSSILELVDCLKSISLLFTETTLNNIESSIATNEDIKEIFASLARDLLTDASNSSDLVGDARLTDKFVRSLQLKLKDLPDILGAISTIVDTLDPSKWLPNDFENLDEGLQAFSVNSSHSFSSKEGRAVIVEAISRKAQTSMEICRDLLLLMNSMICLGSSAGILDDKRAVLVAECIPKVLELLKSFFTIIWLRRNTFTTDNADYVENSLKKFAALELVDMKISLKKSKWEGFANQSILNAFVSQVGLSNSLKIFARLPAESQSGSARKATRPWDYDFQIIFDMIFRSIWPLRFGTQLPEFLLAQGQATLLIEYLAMCSDWCSANKGSREFLLGQAYLQNGEHEKARQHFFKATKFIADGEDLLSRLIPEDATEKPNMIVFYFITVMRLFEQFDNPEMMIIVAKAAIFLANNAKSKEVAMLWSNIFKCHLQLGQTNDAYQAIVLNPDKQRRRNCLHNFIVTLCERKQLQEICNFSYSSMEDDVVNIIETRARTVDITINDYYDLLYAFYSFRGDMRRAATTMYEYACRLRTEMHGLESLQQQAKCFLAAINCLRICDQNYAWIVRPSQEKIDVYDIEDDFTMQGRSPKRSEDGEEIALNIVDIKKGTKKTVIVELSDLEKEYLLIVARLNLVQFDKNSSTALGPYLSANEIVPLLSQSGLFDRAFSIAIAFKLDLDPIFEGIASNLAMDQAFNWLTANDTGLTQSINDVSAVEQTWRLLRSYLDKFTKINGPVYHKSVAIKLLSLGYSLPTWFVHDYKQRNAAELLRILINFDLLEEAGDLAVEYVNAVLGVGKENFGLKDALHVNSPAVWLPYSALDHLVVLLKDKYGDSKLRQVHHNLSMKMKQYFETVEMVSHDKVGITLRTSRIQAIKI
eukprot:gene12941-3700_t